MKTSKERPVNFFENPPKRNSRTPKRKDQSKADAIKRQNILGDKKAVPGTEARRLKSRRFTGGVHTRSMSPKCAGRPDNQLNKIETIIESEYKTLNKLLDRETKTKSKIKRLETELKSLRENRRKPKGTEGTIEYENNGLGRYASSIKEVVAAIQKTICNESLDIKVPALLTQVVKLQDYSERLLKMVGRGAIPTKLELGNENERKILQLKKCLENVKVQSAELERANEIEKERIKKQYSEKMTEYNELIHEQNVEIQRLRKQLEETRLELSKEKKAREKQEEEVKRLEEQNQKLGKLVESQEKLVQYLRDTLRKYRPNPSESPDPLPTSQPIARLHRESKSENMSLDSSMAIYGKYQHNLTDFDIALNEYNNSHQRYSPPKLDPPAESSVSFHEPHYKEFLLIGEQSLGKNRSFEQIPSGRPSDLSEGYVHRRNYDRVPYEIFEAGDGAESNTATFRESEKSINDSQTRTEVLRDEIEELNSEISKLQQKISSAIKKKKQDL